MRTFLQQGLLRQAEPAEQANAVQQAGGGFETTENPTVKELLDRAAAELTPGKIEAKFPQQREIQASILKTVGTTYWGIGEYAKAVEFLTRSSDTYRHAFGADHPDTLATLDNLAGAYLSAGKTTEAIALYEQVRDARMKKLGVDHADTLTTLANLAGAHQAAGRLEQALPLFQQAALGIEKRQFVHPDAGLIVGALSDCHERLKQYDQAEPWRRKWLAVVKERSGGGSLPYATELALLGLNLLKQEKYADAAPLLHECLKIRERKQPEDWTTFNTKSMLGGAVLGQKKYADAEPLLLAGYAGMKQREGKIPVQGKIRLAEALERLVQFYDATQQQHKADEWRKKLQVHREADKKAEK